MHGCITKAEPERQTQLTFVLDKGAEVIAWVRRHTQVMRDDYFFVVGIVDPDGFLKGGFGFCKHQPDGVKVDFYGPGTMKRHTVKAICIIALKRLRLRELFARTTNKNVFRGHIKIGARFLGIDADGCYNSVFDYPTLLRLSGLGE